MNTSSETINECNPYKYKYEDLLIPPEDIFNYLCTSYDKTYLFLISFIRVIILGIIIKIYYKTTKIKGLWIILYLPLLIYTIINIIILFAIIYKNQKISKKAILNESIL